MFTLKKLNRNDHRPEETSQTFEKNPPPLSRNKGTRTMARKQRPDYTSIPAKVLLRTRTNWKDVKYPIDKDTSDEVRTMHKRTVYVNEQRKEWWEEYSRRDEEYCFNKKLEETIDLMSSLSLSD
jgi:hypothetical protein